jgi:hypothetical protein
MVPYATLPGGIAGGSVELDDSSGNNNILELRFTGTTIAEARVFSANVNVGGGTSGAFTANTVMKHAATFVSLAGNTVLNGGAVAPFTFTSNPTGINRLAIGYARNGILNGWARRVRYWPRALTNAELQSVTT